MRGPVVSDGLRRLVEQLGAQLGAQQSVAPPALVGGRWLDYLTLQEVQGLIAEVRRVRSSGGDSLQLSPELMRRASLRQALGLFHGGVDENGVEFGGCRECLEWRRGAPRCRCAEDAVLEAAGSVREVDAAVVAAVRARARVQHERFVRRRRERLLARVGSVVRAPRVAVSAGRRVVGLEALGVPDGFVAVREVGEVAVSAAASARGASGRSWLSAAGVRVANVDAEGRELAQRLGVDYSVSSWKALPTVDSPRRDAS